MTYDEKIMRNCIRLAKKGRVLPNPMVGCIIIKNSEIIGKGFHKIFGGPHAEVIAVNDAKKRGCDLKGASLYVNLEPCSHFGKTPPCADLIISEGIKKVFIGMKDPNPLVSGKGIRKLQRHGIEVVFGICENECKELNKVFISVISRKRPYVILKSAQSIDGKIALNNFSSKWITGIKSRTLAHDIRSFCDGVLIGRNTAEIDNPELTARLNLHPKNPVRIVIDKNLKLKGNLKLFSEKSAPAVIVHSSLKKPLKKILNADYLPVKEKNGALDLADLLHKLFLKGIYSLLVEGGSKTLSGFLKQNLYDELFVMIAPKIFGKGISPFSDFEIDRIAKSKELFLYKVIRLDNDIVLNYKPNH